MGSQVAYCCQKAVGAVGAVVAPGGDVAPLRHVGLAVECAARETVENGEELGTIKDTSSLIAVVGQRVANDAPLAVAGAVGGVTHQLSPSVAVEIIDHELRVVSAGADITAEIDAPQ